MTDAESPTDLPADNPFGSPHAAPAKREPTGNEPSVKVLVACLLIGFALSLRWSWPIYLSTSYGAAIKLAWLPFDVVYSTAYGLGLALLVTAIARKRFFTLAPGHWRLITSLPIYALPVELPESVTNAIPDSIAVLFYVVLIVGSRESRIWKCFGWAMVVGLATFVTRALLPPLDGEAYGTFVQDARLGEADFVAHPVLGANFALIGISRIADLLVVILMIAGVILDWRRGKNRDAYHYIGLILILALPLLEKAYDMVVERL